MTLRGTASKSPERIGVALDGRSVAEPDLSVHEGQVGDRYLLCSDGLSGVVSDETLRDTLSDTEDPDAATRQLIELAIETGCWSNARVDATVAGGITQTLKIMSLAEAHGMTVELQSWGYTTTQAANLHLMLARQNCTYFEQPVPYPAFEYGFKNPIRPDRKGHVRVSDLPGLGVEVDWAAIEAAAILT